MLIQALVLEAAIEALDEAILHRFTRRNLVPLDDKPLLQGRWPRSLRKACEFSIPSRKKILECSFLIEGVPLQMTDD